MRILLICAVGMSTSLLINNMKKFAQEEDYMEACAASELSRVIDNFDIVLVGPQVRYKMKSIEEIANTNGKKAALMDMKAYGEMNGAVIYKQAQELFKK